MTEPISEVPGAGIDGDAATFARLFAGEPDLDPLSDAARRVLSVAAALFYRRGAVATSVRDVTSACRLTPGALYNHFASKDELLYTLALHGHLRVQRRLDAALAGIDAAKHPVEALRAFVHAYVIGHLAHPKLAQVVRREYLHLSPRRYTEIVTLRRAIRDRLAAILESGERSGAFCLLGGPTGQAVMVLDLCSRTSDWFDPSRPSDLDEMAQRYVTAAVRLVSAVTAVSAVGAG